MSYLYHNALNRVRKIHKSSSSRHELEQQLSAAYSSPENKMLPVWSLCLCQRLKTSIR